MRGRAYIYWLSVLLFPGTAAADVLAHADQHWQALARADLEAVHDTIERAHPGAIDLLNPEFRVWMEDGYHRALALLPRVYDYNSMLDAVRYYVVGFQDGHLLYSDDVRTQATLDAPFPIVGWRLGVVNGDFVVTKVWADFPSELPPVGSRLLQCDGQDPEALYRERIAPYFDQRPLAVDKALVADLLPAWSTGLRGDELKRCQFSTPTGQLEIRVTYVPEPVVEAFTFLRPVASPKRANGFTLNDGVLWIRAANFQLSAEDDRVLEEVRRLKEVRAIVFDARGNGGGDSSVGGRIFMAATGGLEYDLRGIEKLPRLYAQWRVSGVSIAAAADHIQTVKSVYGDRGPRVDRALAFWEGLRRAQSAGQLWYEQWEGPEWGYRVDRDEIIRRHGRLKRFSGKIMLVTDSHCASACLDFADAVRLVPGALHVGKTTSADSVYIDMGSEVMPSGNRLWMPLKVWRNRLRGNNEPLIPDVTFDCDMSDDACVQKETRALLAAE
jgi:Peptidase family S41